MWLMVRKGTQLNGRGSGDRELSKHGTGATVAAQSPGEVSAMRDAKNANGAKPATVIFLRNLTARSCLLSPCCVRADMDGLRWAFGRLRGVVGVLCYERASGTCLELLSAGKVVF